MTRRLGLVFAHPDDETFCVGGIAAKYAAAGATIDLFCATNGDAGKTAGVPVSSRDELAELRKREARAACDILGIRTIDFGNYPDGELDRTDTTALIGDIVRFIRQQRPEVILAFGPEGAPTAHRDHRAMSRATLAAFFLSGLTTAYPEQRLEPHRARRLFFHAFPPVDGPRMKVESVPATCIVDVRAFRATKEAAFKAHTTQQGSSDAFYTLALRDTEDLAFAAGEPQSRPIIDDVFEGLV